MYASRFFGGKTQDNDKKNSLDVKFLLLHQRVEVVRLVGPQQLAELMTTIEEGVVRGTEVRGS